VSGRAGFGAYDHHHQCDEQNPDAKDEKKEERDPKNQSRPVEQG
jgi:hypothetical protein